ncbi:MAG: sodium/solute symporter [Spirochaetes bacterium]|nr:sodium/solute symporter [Spirochaetota bacterium]
MIRGTSLDIVVIIAYFIVILGFGVLFGKYARTTRDFFFGGQRFSWWIIAASCIATTVGSYSFIKYSAVGFSYGISSTMAYLNDWFLMPLFVLGWMPIIYFSRVGSIPEYFERRFDKKTRIAGTIVLLIYLIGYIGINLYTIGVAFHSMLGWDVMTTAILVSAVCAIYMHAGGQTSVIMTDLAQSIILIAAGILVFALGISEIGGVSRFWDSLAPSFRAPFTGLLEPSRFSSAGIFWQDAFGSSIAFYFINQGVIMRFMSVRSMADGKRAIFFVALFLMPLAAFAVANAGWIGRSMVNLGMLPENSDPNQIFVIVASKLSSPGVFGFIMAALTAALMSTVDTLVNAVSAISVNDIVKHITPNRDDSYYLKWARIISLLVAFVGILLVPLFMQFESIYVAHGAFTAAVTPPMIVVIIFAAFWKRYTSAAAFWTIVGGAILVALSIKFPLLIKPFAHGIAPEGYEFMRALYGIAVCATIGVAVSLFTKSKKEEELIGLIVDSIEEAKRLFKGGKPAHDHVPGKPIRGILHVDTIEGIRVSKKAMEQLMAEEGDLLYVSDARWWLGGLRSVHAIAAFPHDLSDEIVILSKKNAQEGNLDPQRPVRVVKVL